jgi:hypothetical protein
MPTIEVPAPSSEFNSLALGDARLVQRGKKIVEAVAANPSASFPEALQSEAALEGFYRFINSDRVTPAALLAPHYQETCLRAEAAESILVLHDTTEVQYRGQARRDGLGRVSNSFQGYFAHVALAVAADAGRRPLGLLALETYERSWEPPKKRTYASRKEAQSNKESGRWRRLVDATEAHRQGRFGAIHVMDREGDSYDLLAHLCAQNISFVIRIQHNRFLATEGPSRERLEARIAHTVPVIGRTAKLTRRARAGRSSESVAAHPVRDERTAHLVVSADAVDVPASVTCLDKNAPRNLRLHCVCVDEVSAPDGVEPVRWRLWTRLPIDEPEQLLTIVDIYRTRWLIEEFFKALKTGCALEKRQQESQASLLNVLALLAPIAWRLLLLRNLAHEAPDAPATEALTASQLDVLRVLSPRRMSATPTVRESLLAVAALGGHIRNNGQPGWLVLGRGFEKLLLMEAAWKAARGEM